MGQYLTEKELCNLLGIDRSTAWRWRKEGMPHLGKKRSIRYIESEVVKWLENRKTEQK